MIRALFVTILMMPSLSFANPHLGHAVGYLMTYCTDDAPTAPPPFPGCVEEPGVPLPFNAEAAAVRLLRILPWQAQSLDNLGEPELADRVRLAYANLLHLTGQIRIAAELLRHMEKYGTASPETLADVRFLLNSPNNREHNAANERVSRVLSNLQAVTFDEQACALELPNGVGICRSLTASQIYTNHLWKTLQLAIWHVDDAIIFELLND